MTIHGYHRNKKLAERHRKQLEREHGLVFVIAHRLNRHGEESLRGKHFVFKSLKKKIRWIVTIHIHSEDEAGNVRHEREADFIVEAQENATHRQILNTIHRGKGNVQLRWTLGAPQSDETPAQAARWMFKIPRPYKVTTFVKISGEL